LQLLAADDEDDEDDDDDDDDTELHGEVALAISSTALGVLRHHVEQGVVEHGVPTSNLGVRPQQEAQSGVP